MARTHKKIFALATAMFKELWSRREANRAGAAKALSVDLDRIERQIDSHVERLVETLVPAVLRALEKKVEGLEAEKMLIAEKLTRAGQSHGSYDARLRTALTFLANPWSVWEKGRLEDRRAVLKLTFADRLRYKRGEGFRTANLSLPFKVLADFLPVKQEWRAAPGDDENYVYAIAL